MKRASRIARLGKRSWPGCVGLMMAAMPLSGISYTFETNRDWAVNLDTTFQWLAGVRADSRDSAIANNPGHAAANYKFDRGDLVTNRMQAMLEFQAVYKGDVGFRISGSGWNDFAYNNRVARHPDPGYATSYPGNRYSSHTRKYHIRGGELLDAFVFANFELGDKPAYLRLGRFSQQWGNSMFFGFSGISYGQHPTDFIKGFSQPGSSVKELILPRAQAMFSVDLTPDLSVTAQYFLEYAPNRFPEAGTYLAPSDILYEGPTSAEPVFGPGFAAGRTHEPKDINDNFGLRVDWAPQWLAGRLGFYYRQLDETQSWQLGEVYPTGGGTVQLTYAEHVKLYGISYETNVGGASLGLEANYRKDTALQSAFVNGGVGPYREGARGDIINVLANVMINLPNTRFWDTGILLAEMSYTHLDDVSKNVNVYLGEGYGSCVNPLTGGAGDKEHGCATDDAVAVAMLFSPTWLQVWPSIDLSAPVSVTYGVHGNPAYAAGAFYAEDSVIWSVGVSASYRQKHTFTLQYQDYYWNPLRETVNAQGNSQYAGGNGPFALNDKGWVSLSYQTSF